MMNLKKKIVVGVASAALIASMGVTPAFASEINLPNGLKVDTDKQRYAGDGRVETSLEVAKAAWSGHENEATVVYVVGYDGLVDAATAGMLDNSATTRGPVVALPKEVKDQKLFGAVVKKAFPKLKKVIAVGGTAVVSDEGLKAFAGAAELSKTDRIGGKNRYETNIAIARKAFPTSNRVYLTRGDLMVDSVAAGTLTGGPILLVPHEGDVDKATTAYTTASSPSEVVVIGGTGALSDEQAGKAFASSKSIKTTPWTAPEIMKGLQVKVQQYAALYFGQPEWQSGNRAGDLDLNKKDAAQPYADVNVNEWDHDGKPATSAVNHHYWGLGETKLSTNAVGTEDPTDISVMAPVTDGKTADGKIVPAKYFKGYGPILKEVKEAAADLGDSAYVTKLETDLKLAANKNALGNKTFQDFKNGTDPDVKGLIDALKAYLGGNAMTGDMALSEKDGKITQSSFFKFDSDQSGTAKYAGLDQEAINDQIAADMKDTKNKWAKSGQAEGSDLNFGDIVKRDATDLKALFKATETNNTSTNWGAIKKGVEGRLADFTARERQSREALIDAVRDYHSAGDLNGLSQKSSAGSKRINGKNRYETSALLSIFQSKHTSTVGIDGEGRYGNFTYQYLASGNDDNLIDAVFAGQLQKGTILLVPAEGEVNDLVKTELARKGTPKFQNKMGEGIFPSMVYTVGGKKAVSDEVFVAAVNALVGR